MPMTKRRGGCDSSRVKSLCKESVRGNLNSIEPDSCQCASPAGQARPGRNMIPRPARPGQASQASQADQTGQADQTDRAGQVSLARLAGLTSQAVQAAWAGRAGTSGLAGLAGLAGRAGRVAATLLASRAFARNRIEGT